MDGDFRADNIFQDAFVGCRLAALVVLRLKAVNGNDDVKSFVPSPLSRNDAEGAGDDLGVNTAGFNLWDELLQLTVANEGVATHEGDVKGLVLVEKSENAGDQIFSLEVGELTQKGVVAEMGYVEGVAARAAEGAFLGDFDGKRGSAAGV